MEFSVKKCIEAKSRLRAFENAMVVWGKEFSPSRSIGKCAMLYKILQPKDYEDFFNKYVKYASEHLEKSIPYRGLTEDEIVSMAERYKEMSEENSNISFPLEDYINDLICHTIIETFDGMKKEREAISIINKNGYSARTSTYKEDSKFGIDIVVEKEGKIAFGVQVKPVTFFISKRTDVETDRQILIKKRNIAKENGIKMFYMVYEKTNEEEISWIRPKNNKFAWTYEALNKRFKCFKDATAN